MSTDSRLVCESCETRYAVMDLYLNAVAAPDGAPMGIPDAPVMTDRTVCEECADQIATAFRHTVRIYL